MINLDDVYKYIKSQNGKYVSIGKLSELLCYHHQSVRYMMQIVIMLHPDIHYDYSHGYFDITGDDCELRKMYSDIHDLLSKASRSLTTEYISNKIGIPKTTLRNYMPYISIFYKDVEMVWREGYRITKEDAF